MLEQRHLVPENSLEQKNKSQHRKGKDFQNIIDIIRPRPVFITLRQTG